MSSKVVIEKLNGPASVIVRAFLDEPVWLTAVGISPNLIKVAVERDAAICLPTERVFVCDEPLYQRLIDAYESRNYEGLRKRWKQAERFSVSHN